VTSLRIRVAGRTLLVRSPTRLRWPQAYAPFRVAGGADLVVDVQQGTLPALRASTVFESGGTWTAHARRGGLVYAFRSQGPASAPDRLLYVDRARARATLLVPPFRPGSLRPLAYPLDDLMFQHHLALAGDLVVHACGLRTSAGAVLFCGTSGAGKTTMARLWSRHARGTRVLSDDRVVLTRRGRGHDAHGTPWHGEGRFASPLSAPLRAVFFIRHGRVSRVSRVEPAAAAALLFARSFPPPWDKVAVARTLAACARVAEGAPAWELRFRPDQGAIRIVRATLGL
jgi:hypothetical protein